MNKETREILIKIARNANLTYRKWSELSGVPEGTLNKILYGSTTNPKIDTIMSLLNCLGLSLKNIDPSYLKEMDDLSDEKELIHLYKNLSDSGKKVILKDIENLTAYEMELPVNQDKPYRELQVFLLPASAGIGSPLDDYSSYEFKPFPVSIIPSGTKFAVRITGDSMEPQYYEDDIVFVKPTDYLKDADIGIVIINNEGYIKEYNQTKNAFISFNKKYDPIPIREYDHVHVVGKVLGKYHES